METPKLDETQLSLMRKYPLEVLITALFLCVAVLAGVVYNNNEKIENLHDRFQQFLQDDNKMIREALQKNTDAINRFLDKSEK